MTHGRLPLLILNLLLAAGAGTFLLSHADESKADSSPALRLDFPTTILPILTKAGCNAGACHGAATGQAGFKLSLLGYDPEFSATEQVFGQGVDIGLEPQFRSVQTGVRIGL